MAQRQKEQAMAATYRIRLFFDYGSGICLWGGNATTVARFGYPIMPEQLALSPATCAEVERLILWHERSLDWSQPPAPVPWSDAECRAFNAALRHLRAAIARELGDDYALVNEQLDLQPS
jgi:hypothetical protein